MHYAISNEAGAFWGAETTLTREPGTVVLTVARNNAIASVRITMTPEEAFELATELLEYAWVGKESDF